MASARGKKVTADRARPLDRVREEVKPSFGWTEDSKCHYLLLDLPDFRKQEIKIQIDDTGNVNISGERQVSDSRFVFFEQSYKVPENSDIQKTTGRLEEGLLSVTVPKQVTELASAIETDNENATNDLTKNACVDEEKKIARNEHTRAANQEEKVQEHGRNHHMPENRRSGGEFNGEMYSGQILQKWGEEKSMMRTAIQMVSKNKGIIITAVIAFSLGILVARFSESGRHEESID